MVSWYNVLLVLHILCVVLWLGPDLVSWYLAWILRLPRFEMSTRLVVAEALRVADQYSRTATILLIPTAIGLLRIGGWGLRSVPVVLLWIAAAGCILWAIASFWITGLRKSFHGTRAFYVADQGLRLAVAVVALIIVGTSLGSGSTVTGDWLLVKISLFAVIMLAAVVAFTLPNPFVILMSIVNEGSTPEREERFTVGLTRIMSIVVGINTLLVVMIFMGVTKV